MTIEEKLDDFELRLPLKLRADFRKIRAMLKKAVEQRDDWATEDFSADAEDFEKMDAELLKAAEGT